MPELASRRNRMKQRFSRTRGASRDSRHRIKRFRRLLCEVLEDRRLLSGSAPEIELFNTSPALFVENQGQWSDASVRFMHQGDGANVAMTDTGPVFQLFRREATDATARVQAEPLGRGPDTEEYVTQTLQFSANFVGANQVEPVGLDRSDAVFNYFIGEQANWHSEVPGYELVAYEGLYDGIELRTRGQRSHLKYEFHVAPGADYRRVQIQYDGIERLAIGEDGSLRVNPGSGWGELVDDAPYIYQTIDGQQMEVAGEFSLLNRDTYAFRITGDYDPARELIIDPELSWST